MLAKPLPPIEYLRECFEYNPATGVLTWRERPVGHFRAEIRARQWNTRFAGRVIARRSCRGYLLVRLGGTHYRAHRIAWALGTGEAPPDHLQIDHVNGDRADNRLANLRLATAGQNMLNRQIPTARNRSGVFGVCWEPTTKRRRGRWRAVIRLPDGRRTKLGSFQTREAAFAARIAAEQEHYGDFAPKRRS